MPTSELGPDRLPVLPDATLLLALFEYRYALQKLMASVRNPFPRSTERTSEAPPHNVERAVREAIGVIETEIRRRGLDHDVDAVSRFVTAGSRHQLA